MSFSIQPPATEAPCVAEVAATGDLLASGADLSDILEQLVGRARELTQADYAALCIMDENGEPERMVYARPGGEVRRRLRLPAINGLLMTMARSETAVRVDDVTEHPLFTGWGGRYPQAGPVLGVPIRPGGRTIGCLYAARAPSAAPFDAACESSAIVLSVQAGITLASILDRERSRRAFAIEERQRIARDLRNATVQSLVDLSMRFQAIAARAGTDIASEVLEGARAIEDLIDDMQQYIGMLEVDEPPSEPDLARDLPFVIRQFVPAGIGTVVNVTAIGHDIGGRAAEDLLHIAREALSNSARHGRPSKIGVDLRRSKDEILLTIQDDGIGFDPATARVGLGTTGMRTRAERLGATLTILGIPGMGTTVRVVAPSGNGR